jgi:hypothetical protein
LVFADQDGGSLSPNAISVAWSDLAAAIALRICAHLFRKDGGKAANLSNAPRPPSSRKMVAKAATDRDFFKLQT